jgi:hypothetical protein
MQIHALPIADADNLGRCIPGRATISLRYRPRVPQLQRTLVPALGASRSKTV